MDRKGWFLTLVVGASLLGPLGLVWESWHREPSVCPPCLGTGPRPFPAKAGCNYFKPMLNATCPACKRLWYDAKAPELPPSRRLFGVLPESPYPTVFSEPRILAMEQAYGGFFRDP